MMLTERLNKSTDRVKEGRRTMLETEELGDSILQDLHQQRQSLLHANKTPVGCTTGQTAQKFVRVKLVGLSRPQTLFKKLMSFLAADTPSGSHSPAVNTWASSRLISGSPPSGIRVCLHGSTNILLFGKGSRSGNLEQAVETLKNQKQEQPPAAPPVLTNFQPPEGMLSTKQRVFIAEVLLRVLFLSNGSTVVKIAKWVTKNVNIPATLPKAQKKKKQKQVKVYTRTISGILQIVITVSTIFRFYKVLPDSGDSHQILNKRAVTICYFPHDLQKPKSNPQSQEVDGNQYKIEKHKNKMSGIVAFYEINEWYCSFFKMFNGSICFPAPCRIRELILKEVAVRDIFKKIMSKNNRLEINAIKRILATTTKLKRSDIA
ncbi:Vesicle transport v-SNARE 12 [Artemisia annua]|uniref:Vesicle transport v-SNARE 12 n=1 Tax=Artemisia annua TaxID=35608 RepID=A0A2U1LPV2_ARTAN|nr:Vesicle transport v-SNARE 12 [Artemisia annua]